MSNTQQPRRLIVVLGMHRSGTSAVTRGLQALGVELGEQLLPSVQDNNERGFWEDRDVVALNDSVLERCGSAWDSLRQAGRDRLAGDSMADLRLRALDLLRERLDRHPWFGIKDPRLARLLPFWLPVLARLQVQVDFVLCLRNPISVAESLRRRDGMPAIKAYLLWLQHTLSMVIDSQRRFVNELAPTPRRALVTYEHLIRSPTDQLALLGALLELPFQQDSEQVQAYVADFLDTRLQHARYTAADLALDPAIPTQVSGLYSMLDRLGSGVNLPFGTDLEPACETWNSHIEQVAQLLGFAADSDQTARKLTAAAAARDRELQATKDLLADRQAKVVALSKALDLLENKLPDGLGRHLATISASATERGIEALGRDLQTLHAELQRVANERRTESEAALTELNRLRLQLETSVGSISEGVARSADGLANRLDKQDEATIKAVSRQGEMLDQIRTALQNDLAERISELARLAVLLAQAQRAGHCLREERDEARAEAASARQALEDGAQDILQSWSWRVTAPLRWLAHVLSWIRPGYWRLLRDARAVERSGLLDSAWYRRRYPDVVASRQSPLMHYLQHGAREGRDPGPRFCTEAYLRDNPDVAAAGLNPLVHYVRHGRAEGRPAGAETP